MSICSSFCRIFRHFCIILLSSAVWGDSDRCISHNHWIIREIKECRLYDVSNVEKMFYCTVWFVLPPASWNSSSALYSALTMNCELIQMYTSLSWFSNEHHTNQICCDEFRSYSVRRDSAHSSGRKILNERYGWEACSYANMYSALFDLVCFLFEFYNW